MNRAVMPLQESLSLSGQLLAGERSSSQQPASAVIICCSALMKEIFTLCRVNGWSHIEPQAITSELHNRPEKIPAAIKALIDQAKKNQQQIFVAYGDCGTGGRLDALLEAEGVERIPGSHCYEFLSGADQFARFHEAEIGTFYLTDFLVRHFDRLVIRGLGLDRKPELEPLYFGNYRKLLYIAQTQDPALKALAVLASKRLGLAFEYHYLGTADLGAALERFNQRIAVALL